MKKILFALPIMFLLAAGCSGKQAAVNTTPSPTTVVTQNQDQQNPSPTPSGTPNFNVVKLTLSPQNNSGESGSATIFDVNGKAKVIVTLKGAPTGAVQPDHIHFGTCANLGDVHYPLVNVGNGTFETVLPISLAELVAQQPFALNVHKSAAAIGTYVACGDSTTMVESVSNDSSLGAQ